MKRSVLITLFITFFIAGYGQQVLQGNWRWRSDTKMVSGWLASENISPGLYSFENVRLRVELYNDGLLDQHVDLVLEDSSELTGAWVPVKNNAGANGFQLAGFSTVGKEGGETLKLLAGKSDLPFINGRQIISDEKPAFTLPNKSKTEIEWVIKPSPSFFTNTGHYLRVNGIGYPSPIILVTANTTLPVQIRALNVMPNNSRVKLTWSTATELNNDHFDVLRSQDGKNNWKVIATLKGNGSTQLNHSYSAFDNTPLNGNNYYRIRQYDIDGRSNETEIKYIFMKLQNNKIAVVYPNPIKNVINFTLNNYQGNVTVKLVDMNGGIILKEIVAANGEGIYKVNLKNRPAPGNYIFKVMTKDLLENIQVTVQ